MTCPGTLEEITGAVSTSSGAERLEQITAVLDSLPGNSYLTEEGHLGIKTWNIIKDVVSPEQAALIRESRPQIIEQGADLNWVSRNLARLRSEHGGKWIAVKNSVVVASSSSIADLVTMLGGVETPFITFIAAEYESRDYAYGHKVI